MPDREPMLRAAQAAWVYSGATVTLPKADLRMLLLDRRDHKHAAEVLRRAGGFRDP